MNRKLLIASLAILSLLAGAVALTARADSNPLARVPRTPGSVLPPAGSPGVPLTSTTTAFTYQGRLTQSGSPANGPYDLAFTLYDAPSGGNQVAAAITLTNQAVSGGLFTVQLDFGPYAFQGSALWLGLAVRVSGAGSYTLLSPRQALTAAPYALSLVPGATITGTSGAALLTAINTGSGGTGLMGDSLNGYGVQGSSANGVGILGTSTNSVAINGSAGGSSQAVYGYNYGTGTGVQGQATSGTGVHGSSTSGMGAYGSSTSNYGVYGASSFNYGVYGSSNFADGVYGISNSATRSGVAGANTLGGIGVRGYSTSGVGGYFTSTSGIAGYFTSTSGYALQARGNLGDGVHATSDGPSSSGVFGGHSGSGPGVYGTSTSGQGVRGESSTGFGVYGQSSSDYGVYGHSTLSYGVYGYSSTSYAGWFQGNVRITGTCCGLSAGYSQIDHPVDPTNKYLQHSFVQSSEMKDVYDGLATLDNKGEAVVAMPAWFEAVNRDFRYQLTALGAPGPDLYVAQEVQGNRFKIAGGKPGMKVSWQVTGVRHDPYAQAHPIAAETEKPANERGLYLHPELYGQPSSKQLDGSTKPTIPTGK